LALGQIIAGPLSDSFGRRRPLLSSASALLGVLQYVIGALVAPLVGIGGSGTAVPMATLIAVLSVGAVVTFLVLARE
jgi:DHA1 family bicyclomycin/chloramphenicol resistance-like MFS transporter